MRVAIADDSVLFREGVARLLIDRGLDVIGQAADAEEMLTLLSSVHEDGRPDVVVIDVRMPPTHTTEGLDAAAAIRERWPAIGVLVLSQYVETRHAVDLIGDGRGGTGYLLKDRISDIDGFTDAVRRVGEGGTAMDPEVISLLLNRRRVRDPLAALTDREREILALMAEGRSNKAMSRALSLTDKTVESHVRSIFTKLGLLQAEDDNRRVLAVVAYLRSQTSE